MKTGIIVGRFQSSQLTEGHVELINYVAKQCDAITIVLGDCEAVFTDKNPLPFDIRKAMILNLYPFMVIERILDNPSDEVWSNNLDDIIQKYQNPVLYGSRDSFIKSYTGVFPFEEVPAYQEISATKVRERIKMIDSSEFNKPMREGVIYCTENRFPIVYPTVDIAIIGEDQNFLLGRKKEENFYRFVGGFVDKSDKSFMHAAFRELNEEISNIDTSDILASLRFIDSFQIDDYRYRNTKDSIMTNLFTIMIKNRDENRNEKIYKAADDIEELKWFSLENFDINQLGKAHHILYDALKKYLYV